MPYVGVVLHHSVCPSINGKGYDFYVTKTGGIISGLEQTSPVYVHVCIEGDFSARQPVFSNEQREQLFVVQKLLLRLAKLYGFEHSALYPHNEDCPGQRFPWPELVISTQDGYH